MSYQVTFTETNNPLKPPITVEDLTINTQTAMTFVGKNYSGYGPLIAKNFLHLLENSASPSAPANPIQGQLWFDNNTDVSQLKVNIDGTTNGWVSAGGIKKATTPPSATSSIQGDLWVDTINQQLSLFTGSNWLLVGPTFSQGSQTGPKLESIIDTANIAHTVQSIYVENKRVMIISNNTFTPKSTQPGYTLISKGINIYTMPNGELYRLHGVASQADNLIDAAGAAIPVSNLLRNDQPSTTNHSLNVRSAAGLTVGSDTGALTIYTEANTNAATFYAKTGNSINFKLNVNGIAQTILHVDPNQFVGINKENPAVALDVNGDVATNGMLTVTGTGADSISTTGGLIVSGDSVLANLKVSGAQTISGNINPLSNNLYNLGSDPETGGTAFANVYATNFWGSFNGIFSGGFSGSVSGSATKLASPTKFVIQGDVVNDINDSTLFDGQNQTITFNTTLTTGAIANQEQVVSTQPTDEILIRRQSSTGLKRVTVETLTSGFPTVPIGAIFPFAGVTSRIPPGYLLCDGAEVSQSVYSDLFTVIEFTYTKPNSTLVGAATFCLPDLRGRFALGRDNMDNRLQVTTTSGLQEYTVTTPAGITDDVFARQLGGFNGNDTLTLDVTQLPEHTHSLRGDKGNKYYAVRNVAGTPDDGDAVGGPGGQAAGQAQYLATSGGVESSTLGEAISIMNPYLAINYIIYTGVVA